MISFNTSAMATTAATATTYLTSIRNQLSSLSLSFSIIQPLPPLLSLLPGRPSTLLLTSLLTLFLIYRIHRYRRLSHIPGPFLAGITSLWATYHHWKCDIHLVNLELTLKYGPIVRIGPNDVICTDTSEIQRITHFRSGWRKDKWYRLGRMTPGVDSIFSTLDPELRREKKKKIMPAYAGKGVDSFEDSIDRGAKAFVDAMNKFADSGEKFDMARQVHFCALDTLGEAVYSTPMGYLENNKDLGNFLKINEKILPIMLLLSSYSGIFGLMHHWPLSYFMPREGDAVGTGAIMK